MWSELKKALSEEGQSDANKARSDQIIRSYLETENADREAAAADFPLLLRTTLAGSRRNPVNAENINKSGILTLALQRQHLYSIKKLLAHEPIRRQEHIEATQAQMEQLLSLAENETPKDLDFINSIIQNLRIPELVDRTVNLIEAVEGDKSRLYHSLIYLGYPIELTPQNHLKIIACFNQFESASQLQNYLSNLSIAAIFPIINDPACSPALLMTIASGYLSTKTPTEHTSAVAREISQILLASKIEIDDGTLKSLLSHAPTFPLLAVTARATDLIPRCMQIMFSFGVGRNPDGHIPLEVSAYIAQYFLEHPPISKEAVKLLSIETLTLIPYLLDQKPVNDRLLHFVAENCNEPVKRSATAYSQYYDALFAHQAKLEEVGQHDLFLIIDGRTIKK
jgi:hypothetical protein